jgi:hypothetical protein
VDAKPNPELSPPLVRLNTKKYRKKDRKIKRSSPKEKVFVGPVATTAKRKGKKDKSAKKEKEDESLVMGKRRRPDPGAMQELQADLKAAEAELVALEAENLQRKIRKRSRRSLSKNPAEKSAEGIVVPEVKKKYPQETATDTIVEKRVERRGRPRKFRPPEMEEPEIKPSEKAAANTEAPLSAGSATTDNPRKRRASSSFVKKWCNSNTEETAKAPLKSPEISPSKSPRILPAKSPRISPVKSSRISQTKSPGMSPAKLSQISPTKSPQISRAKSPRISPTKSPRISPAKPPVSKSTRKGEKLHGAVCSCGDNMGGRTAAAADSYVRCSGTCGGLYHALCAGYPLRKGDRLPRMWLCRECFEKQTGGLACTCRSGYNPAR